MSADWLAAVVAIAAAAIAAAAAWFSWLQAGSAEEQAKEAKRANDHVVRGALGKVFGSLDAYLAAVGAISQSIVAKAYGKPSQNNNRREKVEAAQQQRSDVMALLDTADLVSKWMEFEAELDALHHYVAEEEDGGTIKDTALLRLSTRKSRPANILEAMARQAELMFTMLEFRKHFDERVHAALPGPS